MRGDDKFAFQIQFKIINHYWYSPDSQASNTSADLGDFLVRSYAKQIKERNATTGQTNVICRIYRMSVYRNIHEFIVFNTSAAVQNLSLRFSSRNQNSELNSRLTSTMLRDHYIRELRALKEGRRSSSFLVQACPKYYKVTNVSTMNDAQCKEFLSVSALIVYHESLCVCFEYFSFSQVISKVSRAFDLSFCFSPKCQLSVSSCL